MAFRKLARMSLAVVSVALLAAVVFASSGIAAKKPGPTLAVSFPTLFSATTSGGTSVPYGTPYVVSGCGYAPSGVTVVVHSPEAISFAGQVPDASGCISVTNFSSQGPGHYSVDAWQQLRNKSTVVSSTSFDLS